MDEINGGPPVQWPAVAGIGFFVSFVAGQLLAAPGLPDSDAPLAEWADWVNDDGNGAVALLSAYLIVIASLTFVVFAVGVSRRIRAAQSAADSTTASLASGLAVMSAVLLTAGAVAVNSAPIQYLFDDKLPAPTEVAPIVLLQSVGYGLGLVGGLLAAAAFIAVSTWALRGSVPSWFTVVGYVCAVVLLGGVVFIPMVALPIWVLIASVLFLRDRSDTSPA